MIRVRFAPSPTGMLHIGSARTALFNYIFAKSQNGEFLLRIEDTDKERSTLEATKAIFDGMHWLGLKNDGEIVFQSLRCVRHLELAKGLIETGNAYYAYDSKEELDADRELAEKNKKNYRYSGKWRDQSLQKPIGVEPVIRIKIPKGKIIVDDLIKGKVEFEDEAIDDFIIVRSDGTPTYMFAVVVDDIDMEITHVIRGDDHLSNTPKQIVIYNALRANLPKFGHIPLIHDEEGKKLSKRRNATAVSDYAKMGILPEALKMYLLSLGWSFDGDFITEAEAIKKFRIEDVGASASRFDMQKLYNVNLNFIQNLGDDEAIKRVCELGDMNLTLEQIETLKKIMPELKKNNNVCDILNNARKYIFDEVELDQDAKKLIQEKGEIAKKVANFCLEAENFKNFKEDWNEFLKENGLKFSDAGPVLRAMLIGCVNSTAIGSILSALPLEVVRQRVNFAMGL